MEVAGSKGVTFLKYVIIYLTSTIFWKINKRTEILLVFLNESVLEDLKHRDFNQIVQLADTLQDIYMALNEYDCNVNHHKGRWDDKGDQ